MDRDTNVRLHTFRAAILDEAREHARKETADAERAARQLMQDAQRQAEQRRERARRQGRQMAERKTRRRRVEARRHAREMRLRARRETLDQLRQRVLERLDEQRDTPAYRALLERWERLARRQLGDDAAIDTKLDVGGLVAHAGGRRVDYRLPVVVDRVLEDMGSELEELWQ